MITVTISLWLTHFNGHWQHFRPPYDSRKAYIYYYCNISFKTHLTTELTEWPSVYWELGWTGNIRSYILPQILQEVKKGFWTDFDPFTVMLSSFLIAEIYLKSKTNVQMLKCTVCIVLPPRCSSPKCVEWDAELTHSLTAKFLLGLLSLLLLAQICFQKS